MPYIKRRLNFDKVENDESSSESESELFQLQNQLFLQRRSKVSMTPANRYGSLCSSTSSLESESFAPVKQKASDIFKPRFSITTTTFDTFKIKLNENKKLASTAKTNQIQQKEAPTKAKEIISIKKKEKAQVEVIIRRSTRVRIPVKRLGINN